MDAVRTWWVELEPGKSDGSAVLYSELVDGLNKDAFKVIDYSEFEDKEREIKELKATIKVLMHIMSNPERAEGWPSTEVTVFGGKKDGG